MEEKVGGGGSRRFSVLRRGGIPKKISYEKGGLPFVFNRLQKHGQLLQIFHNI